MKKILILIGCVFIFSQGLLVVKAVDDDITLYNDTTTETTLTDEDTTTDLDDDTDITTTTTQTTTYTTTEEVTEDTNSELVKNIGYGVAGIAIGSALTFLLVKDNRKI